MIELIQLLLPIFAVMALGHLTAKRQLIDPLAMRGINDFTVKFAFPALLFGAIAHDSGQMLGVAGVYLVGCLGIFVVALLIARFALGLRLARGTAFALNATYGSVAYTAMSIVTTMFGAAGLAQIAPIIALHSGILLPLAMVLIELGSHAAGGDVIRATMRRLSTNPILMSIAAAFFWHTAGLPVPAPLTQFVELLGKAAPSLALFCVGASLPVVAGGSIKEAVFATVLKLGVLPLTVGALAVSVGISGLPLKVALITAAMPTGTNAFLIARRVTEFAETSARTVVISLVASLPILFGLLLELR